MPDGNLFAICREHWWRDGQQLPAQRQRPSAEAICKKAEVPDAYKAFRQHMQKESAQELCGGLRHFFLNAAVRVVLPPEADLFSVERKQAVVGDGNAVRIAAEIAQHLHRSAERGFGVNHPTPQMQLPDQLRKLFRVGKEGRPVRYGTVCRALQ